MVRASRRKLAKYAAEKIATGETPARVMKEVAAYLKETGRTRESELLVRDIEQALADHGIVIADIASAHPLTDRAKTEIKHLVDGKKVFFRETIDPAVLGGVSVRIPGERFDGTIRRKLTLLKAKQL